MSDYIRREDAILAVQQRANKIREDGFISKAIDLIGINELIRAIPSADVVERGYPNHGYMWICPRCGLDVHSDYEDCPKCGADMRGKDNE